MSFFYRSINGKLGERQMLRLGAVNESELTFRRELLKKLCVGDILKN
jgi:hypothetical protein